MSPPAGYTLTNLAALTAYTNLSTGYVRWVRSDINGNPAQYMCFVGSSETADGDRILDSDDLTAQWFKVSGADTSGGIPSYDSTYDLSLASTSGLVSGAIAYANTMFFNTADPAGGLYRFQTGATTPALDNVVIDAADSGGKWFKVAPLVHVTTVATSTYNSGNPPFAGLFWITDTGSVKVSNQTSWITIS